MNEKEYREAVKLIRHAFLMPWTTREKRRFGYLERRSTKEQMRRAWEEARDGQGNP